LLVTAAEAGELESDFAGAGVAAFGGYVIVGVVGVVFAVGIGLGIVFRVVVVIVVIVVIVVLVVVVIIIGLARWLLGALRVHQLGVGEGVGRCVIGQFNDFNVFLDQDLDDLSDRTCSLKGVNRACS